MFGHKFDLWVPLSEFHNPVDVGPMLAPKPFTRRSGRPQVRLVGGTHQFLGGFRHKMERGYHHPLLELDAVGCLIHSPRTLLILARLWEAGESQRSLNAKFPSSLIGTQFSSRSLLGGGMKGASDAPEAARERCAYRFCWCACRAGGTKNCPQAKWPQEIMTPPEAE